MLMNYLKPELASKTWPHEDHMFGCGLASAKVRCQTHSQAEETDTVRETETMAKHAHILHRGRRGETKTWTGAAFK